MYFFALSHAPPEFESITASSCPVRIEPARNAPSASASEEEPGDQRGEHREQARRHQLAERGPRADVDDPRVVGLLGVVHDPGVVAELVAHLHHDLHRRAAHRADRERGEQERDRAAEQQADEDVGLVDVGSRGSRSRPALRASSNEPNSDVAAMTAVAIAMPFVIAFVEFPTASSPPRISAGRPSNSPDISAMPCALSEIGPYVSIDTIDADRREHAHAGQRDEVEPLGERVARGRTPP